MGVTYRGVYLRRQDSGEHVFAIDPGNGAVDYITMPAPVRATIVHGGAKSVDHKQKLPFQFGDKVNLTIEKVPEDDGVPRYWAQDMGLGQYGPAEAWVCECQGDDDPFYHAHYPQDGRDAELDWAPGHGACARCRCTGFRPAARQDRKLQR